MNELVFKNESLQWSKVDGTTTPSIGAATWFDEYPPWAVFTVEEIRYNVDIDGHIQARGP